MRCPLSIAFVLLGALLASETKAEVQSTGFLAGPLDLASEVKSVRQRKTSLTIPLPVPPEATFRVETEADFATVLVGKTPDLIGYKFVLIAAVPPNMSINNPHLLKQVTDTLQKEIDQLPEFNAKPDQGDLEKQLTDYSEDIGKRIEKAFDEASAEFETKSYQYLPFFGRSLVGRGAETVRWQRMLVVAYARQISLRALFRLGES
jgi:hypothetical protein